MNSFFIGIMHRGGTVHQGRKTSPSHPTCCKCLHPAERLHDFDFPFSRSVAVTTCNPALYSSKITSTLGFRFLKTSSTSSQNCLLNAFPSPDVTSSPGLKSVILVSCPRFQLNSYTHTATVSRAQNPPCASAPVVTPLTNTRLPASAVCANTPLKMASRPRSTRLKSRPMLLLHSPGQDELTMTSFADVLAAMCFIAHISRSLVI